MSKCPLCAVELTKTSLEQGLPALECSKCHGCWVPADPYLDWLAQQPTNTRDNLDSPAPTPAFDSKKAILCPDCGLILRRFKVTGDLGFYLDRCGTCNGVWLDAGEWQAIKVRGLGRELHLFFTESWQRHLRQESMRQQLDKLYRERLGEKDYAEIKRIREWLQAHPQRASLLAYLADQDPSQP